MPVSPTERQFLLSQVNNLAQAQLNQLWRQAEQLSTVDFFEFTLTAFPLLVDPFFEMAAQLSATWFEEAAPASAYVAVTAPPLPEERLTGSVRWALGAKGDLGRERLTGTLHRAVYDGARDTTLLNVEKTTSTWARYASANACSFCRLLATRSEIYTSEKAALQVVGRGAELIGADREALAEGKSRRKSGQFIAKGRRPRGSRNIGEKYHDDCRCVAVEVREGQTYEPPDYVEEWQKTYKDAWDLVPDGTSYADNGVAKAILSEWRKLDGSR